MAFAYSPKIVTDGLVFAVDAANRKSYTSGSDTWYDLSGNGNHGTLTNGPGFDGANGGSLVFDGSNDYANFGEFNTLSTNFTFELWVKPIGVSFNTILTGGPVVDDSANLNEGFYFSYDNRDGQNHFYTYLGGTARETAVDSFNPIEGKFYQIGLYSNNNLSKYFTNGSEIPIINNTSGLDLSIIDIQHLILGGREYTFGNNVNAIVSSLKIYNRALTPSEITQNYNALKSRFGL